MAGKQIFPCYANGTEIKRMRKGDGKDDKRYQMVIGHEDTCHVTSVFIRLKTNLEKFNIYLSAVNSNLITVSHGGTCQRCFFVFF